MGSCWPGPCWLPGWPGTMSLSGLSNCLYDSSHCHQQNAIRKLFRNFFLYWLETIFKKFKDRHLTGVRYLIIDEVHERDMETEMLLLLVKNLLKQSETIKVIIMSATIDLDVYRPYFHTFQDSGEKLLNKD